MKNNNIIRNQGAGFRQIFSSSTFFSPLLREIRIKATLHCLLAVFVLYLIHQLLSTKVTSSFD